MADRPRAGHLSTFDLQALARPPVLIFNPRAGQKLGLPTTAAGPRAVQDALAAAGIPFECWPTRRRGHATQLARQAAAESRGLVIAAGGDGTVAEAGRGLVATGVVLGIMPVGSIMNTARALCIPRDLDRAARVIAEGRVLAMDVGAVHGRSFLEAGGVGLAAGLFGYFDRLDRGARVQRVLRAALRFLRRLGTPHLLIEADGRRQEVRAPMVTVSNGPFVGAAYALAPEARIDDGLLDVVVFRGMGVIRVLLHLALIAGGRRLPPPPEAEAFRARSIRVAAPHRRPLPVHADGEAVGATPALFEVAPGALRVTVGQPTAEGACPWSSQPAVG